MAGYVHAVYILRDFLRQQGRLERELATLRYQTRFNAIYRARIIRARMRTSCAPSSCSACSSSLMAEDSPAKVRDLHCLRRWANSALAIAPGYGDTIKPDGTVFHHPGGIQQRLRQ